VGEGSNHAVPDVATAHDSSSLIDEEAPMARLLVRSWPGTQAQ
jgi:hypothetical protein